MKKLKDKKIVGMKFLSGIAILTALILIFGAFGGLIVLQFDQDASEKICYDAGFSAMIRTGNDKYCYKMVNATDIVRSICYKNEPRKTFAVCGSLFPPEIINCCVEG